MRMFLVAVCALILFVVGFNVLEIAIVCFASYVVFGRLLPKI